MSRARWNGKDVAAKRYNHKGSIHSLRYTIKRSRARRGWLHGHRFRMLKIATPKPLAYIEQRRGPLVWKSYLIAEYIEGQKLYDFLRDSKTGQEQRSKVTGQVAELFDELRKYRVTHGDLKHTSILITENGPVLTDLDAVKVHRWNWTYRVSRQINIVKVNQNVDTRPISNIGTYIFFTFEERPKVGKAFLPRHLKRPEFINRFYNWKCFGTNLYKLFYRFTHIMFPKCCQMIRENTSLGNYFSAKIKFSYGFPAFKKTYIPMTSFRYWVFLVGKNQVI